MSDKTRYIDAVELEKSLEDSCDSYTKTMHFMEFLEYVDAQPTADVAPVVHAEWVHRYNDFGEQIDDRWYCSQCAGCNEYRKTWHCPECGAKMDGKEVKE